MRVARWALMAPVWILGLTRLPSASAALPKVPDGFEVRTVATVPAIVYPCQIATAPDGALYVAEDPMDQVGPYEADLGRILVFRDGKDPVVFAQGFRAIFGMAWHDGALYVMNMPRLTVLRDSNGDDQADQQKELFTNLGPGPIKGALNDHIVSGLQFGMDGYLYISTGDKGIPKATGPDGRSIQIKGGGTLRCRPDGTGIEVVSTGTRNHLEPNLDDRDNLFTYDNTDDGDGWWTRVTHHVDGGYYGYPFDYHEHAERMLPRMAEYGGGSPCGGIVYKEDVWPEKYRNAAFWAEWGKGKVQAFRFAPDGATFRVAEVIDFAVPDGLGGFHPIDLALSYDGRTLYVADWNMGGWGSKTEKVGRIFAITYKGTVKTRPRGSDRDPIPAQVRQLNHPSFNERMRAQSALIKQGREALPAVTRALAEPKTDPLAARHLVWVLDGIAGGTPEATSPLIDLLKSAVPDLRAQAARALGERNVPIAVEPLVALLHDREPTVRLQAIIALGRIGDPQAIPPLLPHLVEADTFLAFSTRSALRRINDWKTASNGLTGSDPKVRAALLAAMERVYEPEAADALARYASERRHPAAERGKALAYLAEVDRQARPWDGSWWGTRPSQGKPPAKVLDWEKTPLVLKTIRQSLSDPQAAVRIAAVQAVPVTGDRSMLSALHRRYPTEPDPAVRLEMARGFGALGDKDALPLLARTLRDPRVPRALRDAALASVEKIGGEAATRTLLELLARSDFPVDRQAQVITAIGNARARMAVPALVKHLDSPQRAVRAAAAEALGLINEPRGVTPKLLPLLDDSDLAVRKAAITALGAMRAREALPALLKAAETEATRFEAAQALAAIPDVKALQVYLRGLADRNPELRRDSAKALSAIRDQAAPILDQLAARQELSPSLLPELQNVFASLQPVAQWQVLGPFAMKDGPTLAADRPITQGTTFTGRGGTPVAWTPAQASNERGEINLGKLFSTDGGQEAYAYTEVQSAEARTAAMAVGSDDTLTVWLNGKQVYDFQQQRGFEPEQVRFDVTLRKGLNRLLIKCGNEGGSWQFAVSVATPTSHAFLKMKPAAGGGFDPEKYRAFALKGQGKADRGRALFQDPKGIGCIKCHSIGGQGGTIGPELSSVGAKYARDELITSVLNPSARISSGYESAVVATTDGRVVTGIIKSDSPEALEVADADAKLVRIPRGEIEARKPSELSVMPNGLAQGLTQQDFADLVAYLESLKESPASQPAQPSGGH